MATKQDIGKAMARTAELAREVGLLGAEDGLLYTYNAEGKVWSVLLLQEGTRRRSGALPFLPNGGQGIGRTKSEALETLRTVSGVLLAVLYPRRVAELDNVE